MTAPSAGFYGKVPARGDFVRHGLPPATIDALDAWAQDVISGSRAILGPRWTDAWMEAPIWRFLLAPGTCGPAALAGLWLPSTDRAGRLFPLFVLLAAPAWSGLRGARPFLDRAEAAALSAIEHDVSPTHLAGAITAALDPAGPPPDIACSGAWWTQGSPRVAPTRRTFPAMPGPAAFAAMLDDGDPPSL